MNRPLSPNGTPTTTGRHLVLLRQNALNEGIQALQETAGARNVVRMSEVIRDEDATKRLQQADTILFEKLGVAVVNLDPERLSALNVAQEDSPIQAIEPERVVYALHVNGISHRGGSRLLEKQTISPTKPMLTTDYLRGYRDAQYISLKPRRVKGKTRKLQIWHNTRKKKTPKELSQCISYVKWTLMTRFASRWIWLY